MSPFGDAPTRTVARRGPPARSRGDRLAELAAAHGRGLRGKVVLVDFWTYTCINWLRTLAYVRAWAKKYGDHGLVVIGVHTPEFRFENDVDNVRQAAQEMRVEYPVALDSDYAVWRAFANQVLAGRLHRRHRGPNTAPPVRRGWIRGVRDGHPAVAARGRRDGVGDDLVAVVPMASRPGRLGEPGVARDIPRLRAGPEFRLTRPRRTRRAPPTTAGSLKLNRWALSRGLDDRGPGERAEPGQRTDRVPVPRPRRPSRDGRARGRGRAVPRSH